MGEYRVGWLRKHIIITTPVAFPVPLYIPPRVKRGADFLPDLHSETLERRRMTCCDLLTFVLWPRIGSRGEALRSPACSPMNE